MDRATMKRGNWYVGNTIQHGYKLWYTRNRYKDPAFLPAWMLVVKCLPPK